MKEAPKELSYKQNFECWSKIYDKTSYYDYKRSSTVNKALIARDIIEK